MRYLVFTLSLVLVSTLVSAQRFSPFYKVYTNAEANANAVMSPNGNTLIYGNVDYVNGKYVGRLLCIDNTGTLVPTFKNVYADGYINEVKIQQDKKILISGDFTQINGVPVSQPVRLNEDGSVDDIVLRCGSRASLADGHSKHR